MDRKMKRSDWLAGMAMIALINKSNLDFTQEDMEYDIEVLLQTAKRFGDGLDLDFMCAEDVWDAEDIWTYPRVWEYVDQAWEKNR